MTSGILLLDKPLGLSSNAALQRVRHAFGRIKGGHTGSLDPLATGMLPLCLGEATKVAGDLLEGRKAYLFTARLGSRTATGDAEGPVVETAEVPADAHARLLQVAASLLGSSQQVPPMYSALKRDGQPLYALARQGVEVERAPRTIHLQSLELLSHEQGDWHWRVECSKGTYIRVLAEDMARAIGSCAHLVALRREYVEPFQDQALVTLEQVLEAPHSVRLLSADAALPQLAQVTIPAGSVARLRQGQAVQLAGARDIGRVRLYAPDGLFLGLGELTDTGLLRPRRLFNDLTAHLT